MQQTGHRSSAVRAYKRPGIVHDALVSTIFLQPVQKQLCVAQLKCGLSSECWKAPKQAVAKPCGASSSKYEPSQKYKVGWSAVE